MRHVALNATKHVRVEEFKLTFADAVQSLPLDFVFIHQSHRLVVLHKDQLRPQQEGKKKNLQNWVRVRPQQERNRSKIFSRPAITSRRKKKLTNQSKQITWNWFPLFNFCKVTWRSINNKEEPR